MFLQGIRINTNARDTALCDQLEQNHIEQFKAVPKTVMINPLSEGQTWLVVDATYPDQIRRRLELMADKPDWVLARMHDANIQNVEIELRDTVIDSLLSTYPDYFYRKGNLITCALTGVEVDIGQNGADPLMAIGALATEDFLILPPFGQDAKGQTLYPLQSGALIFPNGWSLTSQFNKVAPDTADHEAYARWQQEHDDSHNSARLGKTTYEIHNGHVRHFMESFATRVDIFFNKMPADTVYWRRNWGPTISSELFRHADSQSLGDLPETLTPEFWADRFVRSEHETFIKLPQSGAVAFGIKTFIWPVADIMRNNSALSALRIAFETMQNTPSMYEYRNATLPSFGEYINTPSP